MDSSDSSYHDMHWLFCEWPDEDGIRQGARCEDEERTYHTYSNDASDHCRDRDNDKMKVICSVKDRRQERYHVFLYLKYNICYSHIRGRL